jgi:hypothetical protein
LIRSVSSQPSSQAMSDASSGLAENSPALLMSASMRPPARSTASCHSLCGAGGSARSAAIVSSSAARVPCPITRTPRARSASAMARPMPRLEPVTRTVGMECAIREKAVRVEPGPGASCVETFIR